MDSSWNNTNNMKSYISCIILVLISLASCKQKKEIDPKEHFQRVVAINANKLNVDTYKLSSFGRMILFEDEQCIINENYLSESPLDQI